MYVLGRECVSWLGVCFDSECVFWWVAFPVHMLHMHTPATISPHAYTIHTVPNAYTHLPMFPLPSPFHNAPLSFPTYRYSEALDAALLTRRPEVVASVMEELASRQGLTAALGMWCVCDVRVGEWGGDVCDLVCVIWCGVYGVVWCVWCMHAAAQP